MQARRFQRAAPPPLPKIEDDGNPKFVIFIRMANVYLWYPLSLINGGTTAKIMVAAKDNFLGKYIYKDTLARNLAAVIYRDEKEIQKTAFKQFRVLRSATEFRYGYKIVENGNVRSALSTTDVIELPTQDQLKTVLDKVKDFFGDAKESFGKLTTLGSLEGEESDENSAEKTKVKT
ncbi:Protein HHL1, chloroplastic, partial [Cucurbita argyrosperma subsp. sororia]